jgi:hypothetical protein
MDAYITDVSVAGPDTLIGESGAEIASITDASVEFDEAGFKNPPVSCVNWRYCAPNAWEAELEQDAQEPLDA